MKRLTIIAIFLSFGMLLLAQNGNRMKVYIDEYSDIYIEENANFRIHSPLLHNDGTPYPDWMVFGFENIGGYEPVYRAFREVLSSSKKTYLSNLDLRLQVVTAFDLQGDVLEVAFWFNDGEGYSEITSIVTMDEFYTISQKVKQYRKYKITGYVDEMDVQWLGAFMTVDFSKL